MEKLLPYETKIKLIKYLHQEMDFDILAFESGFYETHVAWEKIKQGEDTRTAMGKGLFSVWGTIKDLIPLVNYIETQSKTNDPLILTGFDSQLSGKWSKENFH